MEKVIIGIDLGGTNLRIGAVSSDNKIHCASIVKSEIIAKAENPIGKLCEIIEAYTKENGITEIEAISMGVPSSVSNDKETVICTQNICNEKGEPIFFHTNVAAEMKKYFQVPAYVNNDVDNILLYDMMAYHIEDEKDVVGIYIGTGVGAAVVANGQFIGGKNGVAMDIGHIPYYRGDAKCSCGKKGCCECYASGWRLQEIRKEFYPDTHIKDMFTLHKDDEPMREFLDACACIYAVMITIFNPESVMVGGGVPEMENFPREEFEKLVEEQTGRDVMGYGVKYIYSEPFVGKGVIGAALFARKFVENS